MNEYEGQLLQSLSHDEYTFEVIEKCKSGADFANFKSLNDLLEVVYSEDEQWRPSYLINHEMFQFYRFLVVKYRGKSVATASIIISQEAMTKDSENDVLINKNEQNYKSKTAKSLKNRDEEFRSIIQFMMFDEPYFKSNEP